VALLDVADLTFGYVPPPLFEGVSFRIEQGERFALVAPNGAGKSTLLRILAGELPADRGTVQLQKGKTLGYYRQSHELTAEGTVFEALLSGFGELTELRRSLTRAEHAAESGTEEALTALAVAMDRYAAAGADQLERRVESIADKLGFRGDALDRQVATLSGGERGRLQLGVVLAQEPDLLMLDEPTNHLDLETIKWLEAWLVGCRSAVLVVSHDRAFLDAACPNTLELGRTSFRVYPLPYSAYHEARAEDLERERELAERQAAFVAKTEDFIRRNIAGQKTKQAQSRRKQLDKLERIDRPEDVWARAERVAFRFVEAPRSGDIVLDAKGLAAARGGRSLFRDVNLLLRRGDRLGIVGPNGTGKSTLLKLLAGRGEADDAGEVRRGTNLRDGYFDQQLGTLDEDKTCVEEIRSIRGDLNVDGARQYLARFRFWGDDPLRPVSSLSGGERTRLALAKLLLEPRNLFFLDEPTNHLDIPAAEILEEALVGFEGTVVLVSHDRRFLENVTTRTLHFEADQVDVYEGGFADFTATQIRRARAAGEEQAREAAEREAARRAAQKKPPADDGAARHAAQRNAAREMEKLRRRVKELEGRIARDEVALEAIRRELREADGGDWEKLHAWARQERSLSQQMETQMSEWMSLSETLARHDASAGDRA
jgi:ATP-binding cassette, subfamily F, member 3